MACVMNTLATYLYERRIRQADFANKLRIAQATVSRLVRGSTRPSLELAVQIERETGGAVPATSWIPDANHPTTPLAEDAA